MRTMYDSTSAYDIPADAEIVAGYVDGRYRWSQAEWDRFPNAIKVTIAVFPWNDADVLDCEPGDAEPSDCPDWIRRQQARGLAVPTIYCGGYNRTLVEQACDGLTYDIWQADPTGSPHLVDGTVATQYAWHGPDNGHYDMSLVEDLWPRRQQEESTVQIPQEYVEKFGLPDATSQEAIQGLIDNFEGVISESHRQGFRVAIKAMHAALDTVVTESEPAA